MTQILETSEEVSGQTDQGREGTEATRIRLLEAAIRIAVRQGVDKITWRSVGVEAGLSHSLVRFYFGTGDRMIAEALEWAARRDIELSELPAADVEGYLSNLVDLLTGEDGRGLLQIDYLLRAVRGAVPVSRVTELYDLYFAQVGATLKKLHIDDPDGAVAAVVIASVDGIVLQHAIYGSDDRTEVIVEKLRSMLRALAAQGSSAR